MKLTVRLSLPLFALLAALPAGLHAALPSDPVNPYANVDPDGVPLAITQGSSSRPSPAQQAELTQKQQELESRARNWLLLDYQRQFKRNPENATLNQTLNMYLQLSMNKDLSAVASDANPPSSHAPAPTLHATPNGASAQNTMSLRPDSTPSKLTFTPLISPFNSSYASSASQPFGSGAYSTKLPSSLAPTGALNAPPPAAAAAPAPHRSLSDLPASSTETIDMQTPGMIADKTNPLPGMPSLNLDSLPDPTATSAQEQAELPQIREPVDADLLHQEMTAKAAPAQPTGATKKQTPQPPVAPPAPPPPEEPMPISKQPQLSPVHAPVASPFDMLNR